MSKNLHWVDTSALRIQLRKAEATQPIGMLTRWLRGGPIDVGVFRLIQPQDRLKVHLLVRRRGDRFWEKRLFVSVSTIAFTLDRKLSVGKDSFKQLSNQLIEQSRNPFRPSPWHKQAFSPGQLCLCQQASLGCTYLLCSQPDGRARGCDGVYVRVDEILLIVRMNGHQCALILLPAGCLCALVIEQLVHVLQTLLVPIPRPPVWTRVLVLHWWWCPVNLFTIILDSINSSH